MQCPNCGYMMSPFDKDCVRCARLGEKRTVVLPQVMPPPLPPQPTQAIQPPPMPFQQAPIPMGQQAVAMALICPVCSTPDIQKVSAIVEGGTVVTQSRGVSVGAGHFLRNGPNFVTVSSSRGVSVGQSSLVQMLMPPAEPRMPTYTGGGSVAVLVAFAFLFGFNTLSAFVSHPSPGAIIGAAITVGFAVWAWWTWRKSSQDLQLRLHNYHASIPLWQTAIHNWNYLFCCSRCGCVFHIQTRQAAAPQDMYSLLN